MRVRQAEVDGPEMGSKELKGLDVLSRGECGGGGGIAEQKRSPLNIPKHILLTY